MQRKTVLAGIVAAPVLILGGCGDRGESQQSVTPAIQDTAPAEEADANVSEVEEQSSGNPEDFFDLSGIEKPTQQLEEPFSLGKEEPGYAPIAGEMVIYRPWENFTIFYGDFRHSDELVPLGKVESGLEVLANKKDDFTGTLKRME